MRCYLKNEEATNEAITKDGWLRTGDLGKMDEEGYVYITGRLKELIIKGGIHFFPELPKGPSGKIQRIKIAELVSN